MQSAHQGRVMREYGHNPVILKGGIMMNQNITNISVEVLKVHPRNTEFFDDINGEEYERFRKSIDEDGLLSPLVVAPDMTIISGHQRLKACKELGYKSVPVIINEGLEDEDEKLKTLIAANFGRLKNDPIKQAKLIVEYEKLSGVGSSGRPKKTTDNRSIIKRDDIAKELGISTTQLNDIKRLTTLLPDLQDIISEGRVTPTTGYKILAKLSEEEQQKLLSQLPASQKLTQKQVQEIESNQKTYNGYCIYRSAPNRQSTSTLYHQAISGGKKRHHNGLQLYISLSV